MKKIYLSVVIVLSSVFCVFGQKSRLFISEFHYDNNSTDTGEFIEVSGPAGVNVSGCSLVLYNGSGAAVTAATVYSTVPLTGMIDNENSSGVGALSFSYPVDGIQNGGNDGIALVCDGTVNHFISYEGTFTPAAGTPAAGLTPTDVGVSEPSTAPIGSSIQLLTTGPTTTGWSYSSGSNSAGTYNSPLALPVRLASFNAESLQTGVALAWRTSEETNNSHFDVEHSTNAQSFEAIGRVGGQGNSDALNNYAFTHDSPRLGINYYRLKQVDFDGKFEYSRIESVYFDGSGSFRVYPNPTSDRLTVELPKDTEVSKLELLDIVGRSLRQFNSREEVSLRSVPVGQYWLRVQTTNGLVLKQMVLKQE
jgi:Secretion system C-terminal sorting domain